MKIEIPPTQRKDVKVVFFSKRDWPYYADTTEPKQYPNAFESFVLLEIYDQKCIELTNANEAMEIAQNAHLASEAENVKLHEKLSKLESENLDLRMRKALGDYCEHCEPIYCCNGQMCGCHAMPTSFKSTEKCNQYCSVKNSEKWQKEDQEIRLRLSQLESFIQKLDSSLMTKEDRFARLYFVQNKLTPEPITAEQVKF